MHRKKIIINELFEALQSSPLDHEGRYTEKKSSFWSSATGMITEKIQVPIRGKFCGQYCWGSVLVKEMQKRYLQEIYILYEQGATSSVFDDLWYRFPSRRSFDSCKCSDKQSWGDIKELHQMFLRDAWIDFLCGKVQSF